MVLLGCNSSPLRVTWQKWSEVSFFPSSGSWWKCFCLVFSVPYNIRCQELPVYSSGFSGIFCPFLPLGIVPSHEFINLWWDHTPLFAGGLYLEGAEGTVLYDTHVSEVTQTSPNSEATAIYRLLRSWINTWWQKDWIKCYEHISRNPTAPSPSPSNSLITLCKYSHKY